METDRSKADPLKLEQWFFFIMSSAEITKNFGLNKTVGLAALEKAGAKRLQSTVLQSAILNVTSDRVHDRMPC